MRGLKAFAASVTSSWEDEEKTVEGRSDTQGEALQVPRGRADDARPLQLHLIRHGRLQQTLRLPSQLDRRHRDHLAQCLERYFHPDVNSVERLYVEESDEVRLIRQWAYTNRNQLERVPLMAQEDREATLDCVLSAITRLTGDQSAAADYRATS